MKFNKLKPFWMEDKESKELLSFRRSVYNHPSWKRVRNAALDRSPFCERCREQGKLVGGEEVHHIVDLKEIYLNKEIDNRLVFDIDNLEVLCKKCHSKESYKQGIGRKTDKNGK